MGVVLSVPASALVKSQQKQERTKLQESQRLQEEMKKEELMSAGV